MLLYLTSQPFDESERVFCRCHVLIFVTSRRRSLFQQEVHVQATQQVQPVFQAGEQANKIRPVRERWPTRRGLTFCSFYYGPLQP